MTGQPGKHQPADDPSTAATRSVVMERNLPYPPEKIWRALIEGALLKEWLMENDFAPLTGHRFSFRAKPVPNWNGVIDCEVLQIEPCRKLSYNWGTLGMASVVTFTLTPTSAGTLLRMEHAGFALDQEANYKGAQYGWNKFLGNLERVVAELA